MRKALPLVAASLFVCGLGAQDRDFSKVEVKVSKVARNVYMLQGAGGNIGALVGDDGIVLIDDESAPLADKIQAMLQGITDKPVRFIINTHYHGDHVGGNAYFRFGVQYSELIPTGPLSVLVGVTATTDASGAVYVFVDGYADGSLTPTAYITKLTPAGDHIVYQNMLPSPFAQSSATGAFSAGIMATDSTGNVYLGGNNSVEKLGGDGRTVLYRIVIGGPSLQIHAIAVDAAGRAYLTGQVNTGDLKATPGAFQQAASERAPHGFVVRLNPSGAVDYATYLAGSASDAVYAIAVDASGSAFLAGFTTSPDFPTTPSAYRTTDLGGSFLVRLAPDGSAPIYSTFVSQQLGLACCVAVDSSDNAVVASEGSFGAGASVFRFNPQGTAVTLSKNLPAFAVTGLAVDGSGYIYVMVFPYISGFPLENNLAPCTVNTVSSSLAALTVLDPSGGVLQSTYIPGARQSPVAIAALSVLSDSAVYLAGMPGSAYVPTQQLPGSSGGVLTLTRLSLTAKTPTRLACIGNAASYDGTALSPGEMVSLFGFGLGPANGTEPQVSGHTGFPTELANVKVTFNGTQGPLVYVQDSQINAIAPWSLSTGQTVQVCVFYNGVPTNCLVIPAVDAHPGVFTLDGNYAAALNQDGSINSQTNPARVGSIVSIFAAGLGPINPPQHDGAIVGLPLPVNVQPAGIYWYYFPQPNPIVGTQLNPYPVGATVLYAGPAPFEVAGVSQINFIIQNTDGSGRFLWAGQAISNGFQVYVGP